jgi:hypothetical protein
MLKRVKGRVDSDSRNTGRMATPRPVRVKQDFTYALGHIRDTLSFSENKSQGVQLPGDSFGAVAGAFR